MIIALRPHVENMAFIDDRRLVLHVGGRVVDQHARPLGEWSVDLNVWSPIGWLCGFQQRKRGVAYSHTHSLGLGRGLWRNIWGISIKGGICALD
jgi:hypothetical protein